MPCNRCDKEFPYCNCTNDQLNESLLTRNEKEALLWMLRAFRDKCGDVYDESLPIALGADFCNAWDKLKK